jgi:hypothetical protein
MSEGDFSFTVASLVTSHADVYNTLFFLESTVPYEK